MILENQRRLAAEILGVGKNKVVMDKYKLDDIKKAITRYDIKELIKDGTIKVRIRKKVNVPAARKKSERRGAGSKKRRILKRKERYVMKIRKLRNYVQTLVDNKMISQEERKKLRRMAKAGELRNLRHLQDYVKTTMNKTEVKK